MTDQFIQSDSVVVSDEVTDQQPIQSDSVVVSDEVSVEVTDQLIHSDSVVVSGEVTDQQPIQSDRVVVGDEVSVEVTDQPIQPDSVVKVSAYLVLPSWKSDLSGEMSLAFSSVDRLLADRYGVIVMATLCNRGPLYFCPVISIVYLSFFYSSPNLSGHRLDVYHTSTRGVALVRI